MRRSPKLVAGSLSVLLASAAVVPPALAAESAPAQPPAARTAALLDALGGLLGPAGQQQLQQVLDQLQSGQQPTGATLASLQSLLDQIATTPGLPAGVASLVDEVAALLQGNGSDPIAPALLAPVATFLRQLADTDGVPAAAGTLLDDVADALGTVELPALPVGNLPLDPGLTEPLNGVLDALANGEQPTGTLLAPVADLLAQVAATPGLPPALKDLVDQLTRTIAGTPGALDPLTTSELATVLSLVGNTPGVPSALRTAVNRTSSSLAAASAAQTPAKARQATRKDRAVIKALHVNRQRTRVTARIACPRSAPTACSTTSRASLGTHRAAKAKHVRLGRGRQKTVRLRLLRSAHTTMAKRGGKLRFTLTTRFGKRSFSIHRTLRVKHRR